MKAHTDPDTQDLEARAAELLAPLASCEPGEGAATEARSRLLSAVAAAPAAVGLRPWQRAMVGVGAALLPFLTVGAVAGLNGASVLSTPAAVVQYVSDRIQSGGTQNADSGAPAAGLSGEVDAQQGPPEDPNAIGSEVCSEANAHAQAVLQALLDSGLADDPAEVEQSLANLQNCGQGNNNEEQGEGPDVAQEGPGTGHETCFAATARARAVLRALLDNGITDDPEGVQTALDAIENCGTGAGDVDGEGGGPPAGLGGGRPEFAGPPQGLGGRPESAGPPAGVGGGPPDGVGGDDNGEDDGGPPSFAGPPDGVGGGPPGSAGPPEGQGAGGTGAPSGLPAGAGPPEGVGSGPPTTAGPPNVGPAGAAGGVGRP